MSNPNWHKIIADWEESGLTQAIFCARNNLAYKEFVKKRCKAIAAGKFEKRQHSSKSSAISLPAFSKINLKPVPTGSKPGPASTPLAIEINLPNGINLRVPVC